MLVRVTTIIVAATFVLAVVPASADIVPPDRQREIPMPAPRPEPAPAPLPQPPKPVPQTESAAAFAAIGFAAMLALLCLWVALRSRERSA
jgi:hypothetical protein